MASERLGRGKAMQILEDAEIRTCIGRDVYDSDLLASSRPSLIAILCNLLGKSNFT
jgi:hypothetical protein